ncbi:MAG: hypothetical protein FWF15_03140 [Oscillospiraceae bacterium]|nr:hypothetical protein [Oscillospiraceae bacterium]
MRFLIILLLIIGIILTACATAGENKAAENNTQSDIITTTGVIKSGVPDNKRFNGETVKLLNNVYYEFDIVTLNVDEYSGDVVNDAIYERNLLVQDRLNVSIEMTDKFVVGGSDATRTNLVSSLKATILSGANEYDLVSGSANCYAPLILENYILNLYGAPYIDLNSPWWAKDFIELNHIGKNRYYFLCGDYTVTLLKQLGCVFVNKTIYTNYFGDPNSIYDIVLKGEWTIDKFMEIGQAVYVDLNGDGVRDNEDQFGYYMHWSNLTDLFVYSSGIKITDRDADNLPYLVLNDQKTIDLTSKLYTLIYENEGCLELLAANETTNITAPNMFKSNTMMMLPSFLYVSEFLRDMETDYGIVPFPKYNALQDNYLTLPMNIMSLFSVPITVSNETFDIVCAVMEEMSYQGYRMVTPVYFDVALKNKYMRDSNESAVKMLDIMHDTITYEFAFMYHYELNDLGVFMRLLMRDKNKNFSSYYASVEETVQAKLETLIEQYMSLG